MKATKRDFIKFCIDAKVLTFGEFKLKSSRISPYFFNSGLFKSGKLLSILTSFYADVLVEEKVGYDVIFGPAYKGIPLVTGTCMNLYSKYNIDAPYAFNRKEKKDHGEGGMIVGSKLEGKVLIVDDVITAGTAIREAFEIIKGAGAELGGVLIALDRQERGPNEISAITQVERDYSIKVYSIVCLDDIVEYLEEIGGYEQELVKMKAYRAEFGCKGH